MKKIFFLYFVCFVTIVSCSEKSIFNENFKNKTLRIDYQISGGHDSVNAKILELIKEPIWGGSKVNLIDKFEFGGYKILVFDKQNKLIYSRGFSNLFEEWQNMEKAKKESRDFYESVTIPFPKNEIKIKIQKRDKNYEFQTIIEKIINPKRDKIKKQKADKYPVSKLHYSGNPNKKLDIAVIAEGYTKQEMPKFEKDAKRFIKAFFKVSPFKEYKSKVNFWGIKSPSKDSGTDIPLDSIIKNTILNTSFGTFGIDRYLTTSDIKKVRDLAQNAPYDQIYILVNTTKYGGAGVYNGYNICVSDNKESIPVFIHEFGHAFAALADEYQYGFEKAEDIYNMKVELPAPNITNMVNFDKKWKKMIPDSIPVPTIDSLKYNNSIGLFEGGGYVREKIFRPYVNCRMKSNRGKFCPVCYGVMTEMLEFYSN